MKRQKITHYCQCRLLLGPQVTFGHTLHTVCVLVACLPCHLLTSILITPCNKLLVWTLLCKLFTFKLKINVSLMNAFPRNWKMTNWSMASFPVPVQNFGSLMSRICQVMYIIRGRTNTTSHSAHCVMPTVGLHARFAWRCPEFTPELVQGAVSVISCRLVISMSDVAYFRGGWQCHELACYCRTVLLHCYQFRLRLRLSPNW